MDTTNVTTKCRNCGKDFIHRGKTVRVCCSATCAITDIRRQAKAYRNSGSACVEFRDWVLSLCLDGYGYAATADALGLNRLTVQSWIARSKGKKESQKHRCHFSFSFLSAKSAGEWIEMLRTEVTPSDANIENLSGGRPIFIVCGVVNAKKGAEQLSTIVEGRLRMNPFDGSVYAFCGKERDSIRYMFWDGAEFCVFARRRERGTYPWPPPQLGTVIAANPHDFELILRGHKKDGRKSLNWDSFNCSGAKQS